MTSSPRAPAKPRSLKAQAIAMLARREYSRVELGAKLLAGGAGRDEVDAVLDDLAARGLLSDTRFAQALARQKEGAYAQRSIAASLKQKGVGDEAAAAALATLTIDDAAALGALWLRRFGHPPADEREKARQVRFLQSRGFSLSAIFRLLRDPPVE